MDQTIIDVRGAPYQECWGCGEKAGGHQGHLYHGNYPRGIQHLSCGEKIKHILDRSLRALGAMDERGIHETVVQSLITTSARKLNFIPLNQLKDQEIRQAVETTGFEAALMTCRNISEAIDSIWENRLATARKIMQGPEKEEKVRTAEDEAIIKSMIKRLDSIVEFKEKQSIAREAALEEIRNRYDSFLNDIKHEIGTILAADSPSKYYVGNPSVTPYCVIEGSFAKYFENSSLFSREKDLIELFEAFNHKNRQILFLAEQNPDPKYKNIALPVVKQIALIPSQIFSEADPYWQRTNQPTHAAHKSVVFTLDFLKQEKLSVYFKELRTHIKMQ